MKQRMEFVVGEAAAARQEKRKMPAFFDSRDASSAPSPSSAEISICSQDQLTSPEAAGEMLTASTNGPMIQTA
jgi:hypothetical protein